MRAFELKEILETGLPLASGLEQRRDYLDMSRTHLCPARLWREMRDGLTANQMEEMNHWFCMAGYAYQGIVDRLVTAGTNMHGIDREHEVVAGFDARFRGHVDLVVDGTPVEIKSMGYRKFLMVKDRGRIHRSHYGQMQLYLRHGHWNRGLVACVARDVPPGEAGGLPVWIFDVYANPKVADKLDEKARRVLEAHDRGICPPCECGRCLADNAVDARRMP